MFLIDWIPQSAMTLYIYRVGWTCPARNPITRFKSMKITSCTRTLLGPVRLVGPTDQTDRLCQTSYGITDRLVWSAANFGRQHAPGPKHCSDDAKGCCVRANGVCNVIGPGNPSRRRVYGLVEACVAGDQVIPLQGYGSVRIAVTSFG